MSDLQKFLFLFLFLQKNTGVYDLLDEESAFPKASDETLATKLHQYLGQYYSLVYHITVPGSVLFCSVSYHCAWVSIVL